MSLGEILRRALSDLLEQAYLNALKKRAEKLPIW